MIPPISVSVATSSSDTGDTGTMIVRAVMQAVGQRAASAEPVAVIGAGFDLLWVGSGPIAPIVRRHGLKVGSKLYAAPVAAQAQHVETFNLSKSTNRPSAQDREDAERYRFAASNLVLSGGVTKFGWPIAPTGKAEWDRYIDAACAAKERT